MFETPVLLIIFNRPDTTRRVFEVIRQQKPKYLFVAADGPRLDHPEDEGKCSAARNEINVDWDCELKTLYRTENRGCGLGPSEAITWFFENVDQGIILEDDVIPHPSFFKYCSELLLRFNNDQRISMISGINLISPWKAENASYLFSYMGGIPGWATWKRAWSKFDYSLSEWETTDSKNRIKRLLGNNAIFNHFSRYFNHFASTKQIDVWDYQWLFSRWNILGCSIVPCVNLVNNIGFGPDATHTITFDHPQSKIQASEILFPLKHKSFQIDTEYDQLVFKTLFREKRAGIFKIFKRAIRRVLSNPRRNSVITS